MRTSLLALLLLLHVALCEYHEGGPVQLLTRTNINSVLMQSERPAIVKFYAPWCGHCKAFIPEYTKAAENLKDMAIVAAVNCDDEKELCGQYGVQGFPTVKIFSSQKNLPPKDYQGARTAAGVVNAVMEEMPDFTIKASGTRGMELLNNHKDVKLVLFTKKSSPPGLIKALAVEFHNRATIVVVENKEKEIVEKFAIDDFPKVILIKEDGSVEKFTGEFKFPSLSKFISGFVKPKSAGSSSSSSSSGSSKKIDWSVQRITSNEDFVKGCIERNRICAIAVLDPANEPDRQARDEETLATIANKFKDRISVSWFALLEQPKVLDTLAIRAGFPAIFAVYPSKNKYAVNVARFDEEGVTTFLENAAMGKVNALDYHGEFPTFAKVNPEDFMPKPVEEDDDDDAVKKEL